MNIEKILLNLAIRFESFYQKWISDDENFDATWMDPKKWRAAKTS